MEPVAYLETGVLYLDDNLIRLRQFPADCIDLIYLDPPFFSNRRYEVIWGDEAEVRSFEDRFEGGIEHYVEWMRDRATELYRVLKPTGSLYLHCDPSASHYLKVMLDQVFPKGAGGFRSEVIWKRSSAHSDTKQGRRQHGRIHDVILFYTKGHEWTWNPLYTPYEQEYIDAFYKHVEPETGRLYRLGDLTGPGGASKGNPEYELMGVTRYWRYSEANMQELVEQGRVIQTRPGAVPQYKRYLDEMPGVPLQDLWTDIKPVGRQVERLGYPTQKPEVLLERIIGSSTNRGNIVLDPFCGCGTSIAVAERMRREWIGIDISPQAVGIMKRRVDRLGANGRVEGLPKTLVELKGLGHFEFQNWVVQRVHGVVAPKKSGDMGIDGWSFFERLPIQVKQSERVGRNVVDNFETAIERSGKHMGYLVAFSFTKDAVTEAARSKAVGKNRVVLVKVADVLRVSDLIEDAEVSKQLPDLSSETPDLIRLLAGPEKQRPEPGEFPLPTAPERAAKRSADELMSSAKATRKKQSQARK